VTAPPRLQILGLIGLLLPACDGGDLGEPWPRELAPVPNLFGPDDPLWAPQPHRDRPSAIVSSADGQRLYVSLQGTESEPGREVAVVDATTLDTIRRIEVGPAPCALALHPDGRHLVVTNRFARYASVVDVGRMRVVAEVPVPYYTEAVAFSADGRRAYFANRWTDAVLRYEVATTDGFCAVPLDPVDDRGFPVGVSVPANPRRVIPLPDGVHLLVTSETEMALTLLDMDRGVVVRQYRPNAPVTDAVVMGDHVVLLHTGSGSAHPPDDGHDGDGDGRPGDGTANVGFQDLQNEIDVLRLADLTRLHRYTSDSICCLDYRDVDPERPEAGEGLDPLDYWPPARAAFMPPKDTWIVAGAMPERAVAVRRADGRPALAVVFGGSSEVQTFDMDPQTGALSPRETQAAGLYPTGFGAQDAVAVEGGRRLVVVDHLGETLTDLDLHLPVDAPVRRVPVGDVSGGAFPATDVELGEAFNTVTAPFTVDGDQTCVHCHRDGTPVAKPVSMPLLEAPEWGVRLVLSYRRAYDRRPWFFEAAMDESNFFPVINEFARRENFCCEQSDPRVWSRYPTLTTCLADPSLEGCRHVLHCTEDPPPECLADPRGLAPTRDRHFRAAAERVLGRRTSFGDSLHMDRVAADGGIERAPIELGFDGITRALGLFLLARPRALPNPHAARPDAAARLGELLYHSSETGCAACHPLPVGGTARPTVVSEAPGPLAFPHVITPVRHPVTGADVDRVNVGFLDTFPQARQTASGLHFRAISLRGAWERARFLHDGRAATLREALATPGHPGLAPSERGFNELDGQPNTHGSTSHLTSEELDALVAFVETL
jgi:hypothetical protein